MDILYLKIALAFIFALSVIGKLTGKTYSTFEKAGYSKAIMYATAVAEIILTSLLFTKYELFAVLGLLAIISGALYTLFRQGANPAKYSLAAITVILLLILSSISLDKECNPKWHPTIQQ